MAKGQRASGKDLLMAEDELDWLSLPPLALGPSQTLAGGHSLGGDRQVL